MYIRLLQSLPAMSLAISIVVVICMAISFAALFLLYGRTKSKGVDFGVEDGSLKTELSNRLKKCKSNTTYTQMLADGRKKERILRIITDAILLVLIVIAGALTIFSFVLRGKGEQVYFGDTAYLTVLTSSMQEKNGNNPYLRENDDGVRIHQYALIGIDKVDPADLKEGDIIAFKFEGNTIYVHRIVSIREAGGERFFTTMGDANDISSLNETNISADRIVGVFNGYHKGYLGVLLIYMRSDIGMVALIFVFLLLAAINAAEWFVTRSYEQRQVVLATQMDCEAAANAVQTELAPAEAPEEKPEENEEQEEVKPVEREEIKPEEHEEKTEENEENEEPEVNSEPEEEDAEEEIEGDLDEYFEGDDVVVEEVVLPLGGETADGEPVMRVVYDRSFTAKLTMATDEVKGYYGVLKNRIMSYGKVRSAISWKHEAFLYSTKGTAVKLSIRGKSLYVRLPFDEATYVEAGAKVSAKNDRCFVRVKGLVTLKRAYKAIAVAMKKFGAVAGSEKKENYYLPYRSQEELLNDGLIKKRTVRADRIGGRKKPAGGGND